MSESGDEPCVFAFEITGSTASAVAGWPEAVRDLMVEACLRVASDPWSASIYREGGDPRSRILTFGGVGWARFWIDEKERHCFVTAVGWAG